MKKEQNLFKLFSLLIICLYVGLLFAPQTVFGEEFTLYFEWMTSWPDLRQVVDTDNNNFTELCQFYFYEYDPNISPGDPNIDPTERIVDQKDFSITGLDIGTMNIPGLDYLNTATLEKGIRYALRLYPTARLDLEEQEPDMNHIYLDQWYKRKRELDPDDLIWFEDEDNKSSNIIMKQGKAWLKIVLERGYTITGKLILPDGQDLKNEPMRIKVLDENKRDTKYFTITGTNGGYVIRGLSPGNYYIVADGHPKGYVKSYYNAQEDLIITDPNEIKEWDPNIPTGLHLDDFPSDWEEAYQKQDEGFWPPETSRISGNNIYIKKGKSIIGRILDPNGDALDSNQASLMWVQVFDPEAYTPLYLRFQHSSRYYIHDPNLAAYNSWERVNMIHLDHSGNDPDLSFFLGGFDPNAEGDVIVKVVDASSTYFPTFWTDGSGAYSYKNAELINLGELEGEGVREISVRLNRYPKIVGTIKDPTGTPLDNIRVTASIKGYSSGQRWDTTDSDGYYEIKFNPMVDLLYEPYFSLDTQESLDWQLFVHDVDPNRRYRYPWQYYNENGNVQYSDLASVVTISKENSVRRVDFSLREGGRIRGALPYSSVVTIPTSPPVNA